MLFSQVAGVGDNLSPSASLVWFDLQTRCEAVVECFGSSVAGPVQRGGLDLGDLEIVGRYDAESGVGAGTFYGSFVAGERQFAC